jgi:hypothetical protein
LAPRGSDAVGNVATPFPSVPVPSDVDPFMKVTVPDGVPAPGETAVTFAVKVTSWPWTGKAGDALTVTFVEAVVTVTGVAAEVLVP